VCQVVVNATIGALGGLARFFGVQLRLWLLGDLPLAGRARPTGVA
jgi:hypothetical protein